MENGCDVDFIKIKFNNLKIRWNVVQDSHGEYIQKIINNAEDTSEEHDQCIDELSEKYKYAE